MRQLVDQSIISPTNVYSSNDVGGNDWFFGLLWIAEQITKFGVGNGVSVIIMVSVLASFPTAIGEMLSDADGSALARFLGLIAAVLGYYLCNGRIHPGTSDDQPWSNSAKFRATKSMAVRKRSCH